MTMERVSAGRGGSGPMATNLLALFKIDEPTPEQFAGAVAIAEAFHALANGGGRRRRGGR
jgi:hypothetical protein